jgi:hypothetical protein
VHIAGSLFAIWGGRSSAALLFFSGATHLSPPLPPPWDQEMHAMVLFVAAMVPLTIGEFIAFYFGVLDVTSKDAEGVRQVKTLQQQVLGLITGSVNVLKQLVGTSAKTTKVRREYHDSKKLKGAPAKTTEVRRHEYHDSKN